jgi:hypothetical protein
MLPARKKFEEPEVLPTRKKFEEPEVIQGVFIMGLLAGAFFTWIFLGWHL